MIPKIIRTEIVTAKMIRNNEMILFQVQKHEINEKNHTRIDQLVGELNKAKRHGRSKVSLSFAYDDDPRELFEIENVCEYVKRTLEKCPHLFYFHIPDQLAFGTFVRCIVGCKVESRTPQSIQLNMDMAAYRKKIKELSDAMISYGTKINDLQGARNQLHALGV